MRPGEGTDVGVTASGRSLREYRGLKDQAGHDNDHAHMIPELEDEAVRKVAEKFLGNNLRPNCDHLGKKKSPDFSNLGFFVPNFVVTRLGVEPRTY